MVTPQDEAELHRLSGLLAEIDASLAADSPSREALQKAGLALGITFISGRRTALEDAFQNLNSPLTDSQIQHLRRLGFDVEPDDEI